MRSTPGKTRSNKKQPAFVIQAGLFLLSFVFVVSILCFENEPSGWTSLFREGEPAERSFFSPLNVSIHNETATRLQKERISRSVPDVFDVDAGLNAQILSQLAETVKQLKDVKSGSAGKASLDGLGADLSESSVKAIIAADLEALEIWWRETVKKILAGGVIDISRKIELLNEGKKEITVRGGEGPDKERNVPVKRLATDVDAEEQAQKAVSAQYPHNRRLRSALLELMSGLLKPNLVFNEAETGARQKRAYSETPVVFEDIKKNQIIVQRGNIVTAEVLKRLREIESQKINKRIRLKILGMGALVFLGYLIFGAYLFFFQREVLRSVKKHFMIHALLVSFIIIGRVVLDISFPYVRYLLPAGAYCMILSLLLKPRIGLVGAVLISILNALLAGFSPEVFLYSLIGGMTAVYSSIGLRKRSQFLKVASAAGLANFLVIFSYNILNEVPLQESAEMACYGIMNSFLISIPLVFLLLPVLESLFNLATDITLLELSDLNHPLLRRMVVEAPGTYHHSLVVSTLAESACEAIGANSLLARVGGYFHDIGKIAKAEFFTENQADKKHDRHSELNPSTSYKIITSHVTEGLALARKYKLKEAVADFIPQHQGTCPVYFFYKKAAGGQGGEEKINIDDFRYPGPKPQSKETAVVLLADSVEAASRSLSNVTPGTLDDLVKEVINWKLIDGQLDECDLTLRDVRKIQESFVHNLMGIFHTRVKYPKADVEPLWQRIAGHKLE